MKKSLIALAISILIFGCKSGKTLPSTTPEVKVTIDLTTLNNDKVMVTVVPTPSTQETITFNLPKTVPGTYSADDYGKYVENVTAFDSKNNSLTVTKQGENSWEIKDAQKLAKITYWVNDTYDTEKGAGFGNDEVFSPAGTNIDPKCFMVNTHGFVGYFSDKLAAPYTTTILHDATLYGASSMNDLDASTTSDVFKTTRYAELLEHPIMYAKPDYTTFKVDDMDILIGVYSPNGTFKAADVSPALEKMMRAQKKFLGAINNTKKYAVLIYLSDMQKQDAKGFGALEHPTCTTVVMPEQMPKEQMDEQLKDIVSHEFFHIVTPLGVHSKEIHDFDFKAPKMSKHLWMYEGVTEYFANLFQVNQGLISEEDFYGRMADKIRQSQALDDTMPFTVMSANVLEKPYKDQYLNVYQKGALIGMCLDIIIREKSNGQKGILDLMQKLTTEYGPNKPFDDEVLFAKITSLTYPEVGDFLAKYVAGPTPIPYADYFAKVGITQAKTQVAGNVFLKGQTPYITVDQTTKEIIVLPAITLPDFYSKLGIKNGDIITAINGKNYSLDNIYDMITESQNWKEGDAITVSIKRNGKAEELKGKVILPFEEVEGYNATDSAKKTLREAWLKG